MGLLDKIPGFGFESKACFSDKYAYLALKNSKSDKLTAKLAEDHDAFTRQEKTIGQKVLKSVKLMNATKILGYFPVIGIGIGIQHMHLACSNKKCFSAALIARGIFEMLGLGFLFLIPDLIVKCVRDHKVKADYKKQFEAKEIKPTRQEIFAGKIEMAILDYMARPPKADLPKSEKPTNEAEPTTAVDAEQALTDYVAKNNDAIMSIVKKHKFFEKPGTYQAIIDELKSGILDKKALAKAGIAVPKEKNQFVELRTKLLKECASHFVNSKEAKNYFDYKESNLESYLGSSKAKNYYYLVHNQRVHQLKVMNAAIDFDGGLISKEELDKEVQENLKADDQINTDLVKALLSK